MRLLSSLALVALAVPLRAQGPPSKIVQFTTGKFEAKLGNDLCTATLGHPGSDLEFYQGNVLVFGANYSGKGPDCQIRLALSFLKGPGKYGKANISNLSLNWGPTQPLYAHQAGRRRRDRQRFL